MGGKRRITTENLSIPMSSMIDVTFLLLIYFVVTQREEIAEAHLAVNLPSVNRAQQKNDEKPNLLEIEVHTGQYYLKKNPMTLAELQDTLGRMTALDTEQTVIVKTSVLAQTRELVTVLDTCKGLGLTKLNVMTLK
jgi:biopolymer transport protein ExbD